MKLPPFAWTNPHRTVRRPLLADNLVVASQPLAAQAGLQMLASGGNAIDAAVAAAAVLAVVEPTNNGLGGDAFAQVWHEGVLHGINGSGRAPQRASPRPAGGGGDSERGWASVTVPGAVSLWCELSARLGSLPLARVMAPAIGYARTGFIVAPQVAEKWAQTAPLLAHQPGFAAAYLPGGRAPAPGERFHVRGQAETLERIAQSNGRDFYEGETAARIARYARETGGSLETSDLVAHRASWDTPIAVNCEGLSLHEMPPNGQGIVALMALGMLTSLDVHSLPPHSTRAIHYQIEALKLAFADARLHVGDPQSMSVPVGKLLDPAYLAARARLIDASRAQAFGPGVRVLPGTVYIAAGDARGGLVSLIQSNYMGFGSGVVVPGTGVSLHNRGACFSLEPGHPNQGAPGKRPLHTILPGIVTVGASAVAALGSTGGSYQPQGHVQIVLKLLHGENPQAIVDAPRFRVDAGRKVTFEPGFDAGALKELAALGHDVHAQTASSWDFGGMQLCVQAAEGWLGASDARRDSQAVGF